MATGVIKKLSPNEKSYYTAKDIMERLDVGRSKAYQMIRAVRQELIDDGRLTKTYPEGRVPKKYMNEKCMFD